MTQFSFTLRQPALRFAMIAWGCLAALWAGGNMARAAVLYNNDTPNNLMGAASRPANAGAGKVEIEAADDFVFTQSTRIDGATFTGLLPSGAPLGNVTNVAVEIYRVFPLNSTNPSDGNVPTRTNSPSDNALLGRDSSVPTQLTFTSSLLAADFTANNSVLNGINKSPNQTTGGEGATRGEEVQFTLTFPGGITLPADHYFFKPEVGLSSGDFFWLSATRPIVGQFAFTPDLQAWIRNTGLDPDWLRIGTDIVGGATPPTFNLAFSLSGAVVPEPTSSLLLALGAAGLLAGCIVRRRKSGRGPVRFAMWRLFRHQRRNDQATAFAVDAKAAVEGEHDRNCVANCHPVITTLVRRLITPSRVACPGAASQFYAQMA